MQVGYRPQAYLKFVVAAVAFFVVSSLSGYATWSLLAKKKSARANGFCLKLEVDLSELKRKYLDDLGKHVRWYFRTHSVPFEEIEIVDGRVIVNLPTSFNDNDALELGKWLIFPLLKDGNPGLTVLYDNKYLSLAPTAGTLSERLLASMIANTERLKVRYGALEGMRFRIEHVNQSSVLVRMANRRTAPTFSKHLDRHPTQSSIHFLLSAHNTSVKEPRYKVRAEKTEVGWFDSETSYHISREALIRGSELTNVAEADEQNGTKLLRLRLQSAAAHRLKTAIESYPNQKLSLSAHNRIVSTIQVSDIIRYGAIDFPVPAEHIRKITNDIRLSFASTIMQATDEYPCRW